MAVRPNARMDCRRRTSLKKTRSQEPQPQVQLLGTKPLVVASSLSRPQLPTQDSAGRITANQYQSSSPDSVIPERRQKILPSSSVSPSIQGYSMAPEPLRTQSQAEMCVPLHEPAYISQRNMQHGSLQNPSLTAYSSLHDSFPGSWSLDESGVSDLDAQWSATGLRASDDMPMCVANLRPGYDCRTLNTAYNNCNHSTMPMVYDSIPTREAQYRASMKSGLDEWSYISPADTRTFWQYGELVSPACVPVTACHQTEDFSFGNKGFPRMTSDLQTNWYNARGQW